MDCEICKESKMATQRWVTINAVGSPEDQHNPKNNMHDHFAACDTCWKTQLNIYKTLHSFKN